MTDRVPTYPGRVLITPVGGTPYYATIERADEASVEGTELTKATLYSAEADAAVEDLTGATGKTPSDGFYNLATFLAGMREQMTLLSCQSMDANSGLSFSPNVTVDGFLGYDGTDAGTLTVTIDFADLPEAAKVGMLVLDITSSQSSNSPSGTMTYTTTATLNGETVDVGIADQSFSVSGGKLNDWDNTEWNGKNTAAQLGTEISKADVLVITVKTAFSGSGNLYSHTVTATADARYLLTE